MEEIIQESDFLFYRGEDGNVHAQVILGDETVWVSQKTMSEIFGVSISTINEHIQNIFKSEELNEGSVIRKIRITANDGKPYLTKFYNLEAIIAVGYRVNSYKATKFRQWSSRILREYLEKGFVLDDERLKQGNRLFGKDYFRELLERIREIRASEKMFYEKVKDLYQTSVDYDKNDPETHKFFAKIQNKIEFAIVGKTSAEMIKSRANALMPNMGLKTWKNIKREGNIQKTDTSVAKNYYNEEEIRKLNSLVNMYLDYAELQVERNKLMKMVDWEKKLNDFFKFNEFPVLNNAGNVSKDSANKFAENEYSKFKAIQDNAKNKFDEISKDILVNRKIPSNELEIKKKVNPNFGNILGAVAKAGKPNKE